MTTETKTILLVGGAAVVVYLLTRPRAATQPLIPNYSAYAYQQQQQPGFNPQIISASASAIASLIPALSSLFGGSNTTTAPASLPGGYYV